MTLVLDNRFWSKVDKTDYCWNWTSQLRGGYGIYRLGRKIKSAHRLSYEYHHGPPGKELVCHTCDNRACVNPDHLFLGSHQDNHDDMKAKGRGRQSLSNQDILEIYYHDLDENSLKNLALKFEVPREIIWAILTGRRFKFITGGVPRSIPKQQHKRKLTERDELEIFNRMAFGQRGIQGQLALEYNVSNSEITRIKQKMKMEN